MIPQMQTASNRMGKLEATLAQAVRNSLNLPDLQVSVRRSKAHRTWSFRLHKDSASSGWIELNAGAIEIMKKLGLLPALHLGTFRVAYQELRLVTEKRKQGTT